MESRASSSFLSSSLLSLSTDSTPPLASRKTLEATSRKALETTSRHSNRTSSRSTSSWDGYATPPAARVTVTIPDAELLARAEQAAARIDFPRLDDPNNSGLDRKRWRSRRAKKTNKHDRERFTTFARRSERSKSAKLFARATGSFKSIDAVDKDGEAREDEQIVAVGELSCSMRELQFILSTSSDAEHNAIARLLFGKSYIHGSVVHATAASSESPVDAEELLQQGSSGPVVVKTGAFVHSGLFGANEQWCYLEKLTASDTGDAFTVTLASLDERDLAVGKMKTGHVDAISRVTAGFRVERIASSSLLRVIFSGRLSASAPSDARGSMSRSDRRAEKLAREHLKRLSAAVARLPETVRARRLGFQRLADRSAFSTSNTHCTCCTKALALLALVHKKKRCHLCGLNVCDDCWSIHQIESRQGQLATVRVCRRCLELIDKGDYSRVNRPSREGSEPRVLPDAAGAEPSGKVLTRLLHDALHMSQTAKQRQSVLSLIRHLVSQDKQQESERSQANGSQAAGTVAHRLTEDGADLGSESSHPSSLDDKQYDAMLESLRGEPSLALDACLLANNKTRAYALRLPDDADTPSEAPIPSDEAQRLEAIERQRLMALTDTDELDIICTLIAREMECSTGLVTIIDDNSQKVLASNVEPLRQMSMPRNHSFCQHTVMAREPLLAPHPEADVRFQNLPPLRQMGVGFYFGFPLFGADNTVVGSVCCLDQQSHKVTQAQYSAMKRLATTASKIVQVKGRAAAASSTSLSSSVPIAVL